MRQKDTGVQLLVYDFSFVLSSRRYPPQQEFLPEAPLLPRLLLVLQVGPLRVLLLLLLLRLFWVLLLLLLLLLLLRLWLLLLRLLLVEVMMMLPQLALLP